MLLLFTEADNVFFQDIREPYFRAYCENIEDIYKRGLIIDEDEIDETLKYPKPKKPKSYTDQQTTMLIGDREDYNHIRRHLDKFKRSAVWVNINSVNKRKYLEKCKGCK